MWTSPLPGDTAQPLRYIDLTGGVKPYLLTSVVNNLGAQTTLSYAPSTKFYLQDRAAGTPWVTRLPFPVHVVERVQIDDADQPHQPRVDLQLPPRLLRRRRARVPRLRPGGPASTPTRARRRRGPARSPARRRSTATSSRCRRSCTRTWYHTGAYFDGADIAAALAAEYYRPRPAGPAPAARTVLPAGLSAEESARPAGPCAGGCCARRSTPRTACRKACNPYTTTEHRYQVAMLQPTASVTAGGTPASGPGYCYASSTPASSSR